MANFDKALKKILGSEGGYANDPDDPGRETYCGISRKFWPKWEGWEWIDAHKKNFGPIRTNEKIKGYELLKEITAFYYKYFWKPLKCDLIDNQSVAESLFDHAVNAGGKTAVRMLQREINLYAQTYESIAEDGLIGPKTIGALAAAIQDEPNFPNHFIQARISTYFQKCYDKKFKFKYLKGWVLRCLKHLEK